jgi:hypothetical protein
MKNKFLSNYLYATPRTLLFYFAVLTLLLSTAISSLGLVTANPAILITGSVILAVWFIIIFAGVLPRTDTNFSNRIVQLKRGALIIFVFLFTLGLLATAAIGIAVPRLEENQNISGDLRQLMSGMQRDYEYSDGAALSQQAVDNLLNGQNPYAHANIVQAFLKYQGGYDSVTALRAGTLSQVFPAPSDSQLKQMWANAIQTPSQVPPEIESRVCYPAGSFLLPAPFIFLGVTDIRVVYAIFFLAGLAYAIWVIPKQKRFLFIGVVLISLELWNSMFAGGEPNNLCFPLLLIAWLALNRNMWLSAISMGLAVATRQTAWFFLPFYLILVFRTLGTKKLLTVLSIIAGLFLVTNLPFIIADSKLWLNSVTSPMTDPMFPTGGGLITLVTSGLINIQSTLPFTALEMVAFTAAVLWYFKYCKRYPQTGPILAIVPLFFAWRSMFPYFFYVDIIVLAYILVNDDAGEQKMTSGVKPRDNKPGIQAANAG